MSEMFHYQNNQLFAEDIAVSELASTYGTPLYVYSRSELESRWLAFDQAFGNQPHLVCYAVKTNSNLAVLQVLAKLGSGFDIVSQGELERVLRAGGEANKVVFSGVAKREVEIERALAVGIRCFNIESHAELARIQSVAERMDKIAPISIRVNPNVDAKTHPYISTGLKENKFGVDIVTAPELYQQAAGLPNIKVIGIDCHIGSQLTEIAPFVDALKKVLELKAELAAMGIAIHHLDLGGGLGIRYTDQNPPAIGDYLAALLTELNDPSIEVIIEPGRAIAGNAGILVTEVEYLKPTEHKNFAIIDAAMNDLIRPALYQAYQDIIPVKPRAADKALEWDIVGPVCETGDFLGKNRRLNLAAGDLLAVMSAGAYGFTMSSNYNTRPRAAEVMVQNNQAWLVRPRETYDDLMGKEQLIIHKK
ncbi:diaminopimelate decarboxylase [Thiomicrospira cyclica]|uniref:Diaminopimelate decarboxylase n=1 Tax=Thiomicrospira cyclica (strain DSM 14477 / JCM 11371 / ALM1) TaxID=717773 RepID=F6D9H0_THICA|nr:diaminopimelate decarboxylase [Thiomicrospira cyclica]AEG30927.1 diaminopimelate decarboxylase [Thiomicrospira cyclica ALM1]